jgi:hypothetical protein
MGTGLRDLLGNTGGWRGEGKMRNGGDAGWRCTLDAELASMECGDIRAMLAGRGSILTRKHEDTKREPTDNTDCADGRRARRTHRKTQKRERKRKGAKTQRGNPVLKMKAFSSRPFFCVFCVFCGLSLRALCAFAFLLSVCSADDQNVTARC